MSSPARHLQVVDEDGVLVDCPSCAALKDMLKGAERDLNTWRARCKALERDKRAEAEASKHWSAALAWRSYWQRACGHPNVDWDADSNSDWFWLLLPFMKSKLYRPWIKAAIDGAAYDPGTRALRNGRIQKYDDWELIFRAPGKFQSFVRRAPNPVEGELPEEFVLGGAT